MLREVLNQVGSSLGIALWRRPNHPGVSLFSGAARREALIADVLHEDAVAQFGRFFVP